jgi:hypothetical protein
MRAKQTPSRRNAPSARARKAPAAVPVAVTGMHRTGTSMVAKALRLGGMWFGEDEDFISPASDNPEGFFEHERLVRLNDELLEATGGAWDHPPARGPLAVDDPRVSRLADTARKIIGELSVHDHWSWKDPRICLTAPFWLDLVPNLHFIVCVRHPVEVAMSLKRRNRVSYALGLNLWETYYTSLLEAVPPDRRLVTHFGAHFDASGQEIDRILDFAGLSRRARSRALSGVNPQLRHQQAGISLTESGVGSAIIELYERLCGEAGWGMEIEAATKSSVSVHQAVLDLAASKDVTEKQRRHIDLLEGRVGELQDERDRLTDRVGELQDERDNLSELVGELKEASSALAERAAVESDASLVLSLVVDRMEALEHGMYDLLHRPVTVTGADDQVVIGCRKIVQDHVPYRVPILVAGKSDPAYAALYGHSVTNFPQDRTGRYPGYSLANSQALIAHFEALRYAGDQFLLIPSPSRWLLDHYSAFGEHLLDRYRVVASDSEFGLLIDMTDRRARADRWPSGAATTVDRIAAGVGRSLIVLDLTKLDMASRMPNHNVFSPSTPDGRLPYLDATVDVVLIESDLMLQEAQRVAIEAVVTVRRSSSGLPEVESVDRLLEPDAGAKAQMAVIVTGSSPSAPWLERLREALEEEPATYLVTSPDPDAVVDADIVALIDEGVLPLPSSLSESRAALSKDEGIGGVAVKLLDGYGSLEAAGTTLFADGSFAGVGSGSFDVAAPWHEYVRETCWGPGLMVYRVDAVKDVIREHPSSGSHALWAEKVWAAGYRVLYQPGATAVRVTPSPSVDAAAGGDTWASHRRGRPLRPLVLDETAWRELLALEDVTGRLG